MAGIESVDLSQSTPSSTGGISLSGTWGAYFNSTYKCWRIHWVGGYIRFTYTLPSPQGVNLVLRLASGSVGGSTNCPITVTFNGNTVTSGWDPHRMSWYNEAWYIPPDWTKAGANLIEIKLDSGASTVPFIQKATVTNFDMQTQQQTQWCWAATAASTAKYFSPGSAWTQCKVVNAELGRSDCCGSAASGSNCNKPWYLDKALSRVGCFVSYSSGTASAATIKSEAARTRPVGARIGWSGGGGHFMMLTGVHRQMQLQGYEVVNVDFVGVEDPWYGSSYMAYDTFKNNYQGSGSWTHTYYTQP